MRLLETPIVNVRRLKPASLSFSDPQLEVFYQQNQIDKIAKTIRPAFTVLLSVIIFFGFLDPMLLGDASGLTWQIRLMVLVSIVLLIGYTYFPFSYTSIQFALGLMLLVLNGLNISLIIYSSAANYYFVGLILLMTFGYFTGLRFVIALVITIVSFALYLMLVELYRPDIISSLAHEFPFLLAAFVITGFTGYNAEVQRRILFFRNWELEQERNRQETMALHDPLTGLPNRLLFEERIRQSLARARRQREQFAVFFIDLDDFKFVNDNYGHQVGDKVLQVVAERIKLHIRTEDTVARIGGDEFVILSEFINDPAGVEITAQRILEEVSAPIHVPIREQDQILVHITASLGISLCPADGDSLEDLIERADQAMYAMKKDGKGGYRFHQGNEENS